MSQDENSLDTENSKPQKSTRTLIPVVSPLHNSLCQRYQWYCRWSGFAFSKVVHWTILFLCIVGTAGILQAVILAKPSPSIAGLTTPPGKERRQAMWKDLRPNESTQLEKAVELIKPMNDYYEENIDTEWLKAQFRKPDSHIYFYDDGETQVVFVIVYKNMIRAYRIQTAGFAGPDAEGAMQIVCEKLVEVMKEKKKPFFAVVRKENSVLGNAFYGATPVQTQNAGIRTRTIRLPSRMIGYTGYVFTVEGHTVEKNLNELEDEIRGRE